MSAVGLSPRLQLIYQQLRPGRPVWDLCCDHGYLGEQAISSGHFPQVHFVDQVAHIIQKLELRLGAHSCARFYACSVQKLEVPITGNVILAGVGAERILRMIEALKEKSLWHPEIAVLGPQKDEGLVEDFVQKQEIFYKIKVLEVAEGTRQRRLFVLESNHDNRAV